MNKQAQKQQLNILAVMRRFSSQINNYELEKIPFKNLCCQRQQTVNLQS